MASVKLDYKRFGDLGKVADEYADTKTTCNLHVQDVYDGLYLLAQEEGTGSQDRKIEAMVDLFSSLDHLSLRYVVRILIGKLRLGFSGMTILDALSFSSCGDKSLRSDLERAYNISADIGLVASTFLDGGVSKIRLLTVTPGIPIRPAQAERLPSAESIMDKVGNCFVEAKYDGFRVQVHIDLSKAISRSSFQSLRNYSIDKSIFVRIFSRNLEDITRMFPDIIMQFQQMDIKSAIFDGEAIGYNPETNEFLPFQETMQRKRKHDIRKKMSEVPLKVFVYDLLYLDGDSLLNKPYIERRELLDRIIPSFPTGDIVVTRRDLVRTANKLHLLFDEYVAEGLEGIMCKKSDSLYQAGARNFNWIKLKRATDGSLADTVDAVVMGYYSGKGKRLTFGIGAFLVGVYDEVRDAFVTVAKIGTGLTDEQWHLMKSRCEELAVSEKPIEYDVPEELYCDVWCDSRIVVTIRADEITRSPMHTCARGAESLEEGVGLALRFPRLVDIRDDKSPHDATTVEEMLRLYGFVMENTS